MEVVLSGIRATGRLHFGNFLGAVQNFVKFQNSPDHLCMYFVADLHTLTTLDNPAELRSNLLEIVKDFLAAGLDPEKSVIYTQSSIPEITELCILLGMVQPLGELLNIPTYKDLVKKYPDRVSHGLLTYPVLMAADILGPKATLVPVGEDQIPNVELARAIARRFNSRYGQTFVLPEMMAEMIKVPGLDGEKMGKSESYNAIDINSSIYEIRRRYAEKGITDPNRKRSSDPGDPNRNCKSVFPVHQIINSPERTRQIANRCRTAQIGCVECKNLLVDEIAQILTPFQERRRELADKDNYVREILHEGGKKARVRIAETVCEAREKMGVVVY